MDSEWYLRTQQELAEEVDRLASDFASLQALLKRREQEHSKEREQLLALLFGYDAPPGVTRKPTQEVSSSEALLLEILQVQQKVQELQPALLAQRQAIQRAAQHRRRQALDQQQQQQQQLGAREMHSSLEREEREVHAASRRASIASQYAGNVQQQPPPANTLSLTDAADKKSGAQSLQGKTKRSFSIGNIKRHTASDGFITSMCDDEDVFLCQRGFGNHHTSEAIAGALPPSGTNMLQKHPLGLHAEHLNGTSFISSRETVSNVWMYRIRPAVVHRPLKPIKTPPVESCFSSMNPNVEYTPLSHTWGPPPRHCHDNDGWLDEIQHPTFVQGLRTICGHGDPTLKEGLAVHMYAFGSDMNRQAFVNNDGEFLIVPRRGCLNIQTELGHLQVSPGHIAVIPPGFRFAVRSLDATSRPEDAQASGYILEIFGTHFKLPDLGPLGGNALAHVRDFEYPVASFDLEHPRESSSPSILVAEWEVITKLGGKYFAYTQPHTPFDVAAWHGRYAPYRYDLAKFGHLTANTDQLDPTAYTVLTAPSKWPGVSLVDFCVFGEKYFVAQNTLRMPYYHRTMATELVGVIKGQYKGSVRPLEPGGLSFEQGYMPHGESYEAWKRESERKDDGKGVVVGRDSLSFMFHVSSHVALTKWAMEGHADIRMQREDLWDNFQEHASEAIDRQERQHDYCSPSINTNDCQSSIVGRRIHLDEHDINEIIEACASDGTNEAEKRKEATEAKWNAEGTGQATADETTSPIENAKRRKLNDYSYTSFS